MKILIVDDEYLAVENMLRHLSSLGYEDIESTTDVLEAIKWCEEGPYDVVFLDINMPVKNGLEAGREIHAIRPDAAIVFVTAYHEHALESYEIGAVDYVLKPVTKERLQIAVGRASQHKMQRSSESFKIISKFHARITMVEGKDIIYVEAQLNDTLAHTAEHDYFTGKRISEIEPLLEAAGHFMKVHRSCIINLNKVDYFETIEQGKYCIHFKDSKNVVYTSRSGAQSIREYFETFA